MEQKVYTFKVTGPGFELMLGALRQLPHIQVDGLVRELWNQFEEQNREAAPEPAPAVDA